jgi:primary-amine oxidase
MRGPSLLQYSIIAVVLFSALALPACRQSRQIENPQSKIDTPHHPVDPLTPAELQSGIALLRSAGKLPNGTFVVTLALDEPAKQDVLAFTPGQPITRKAVAVLLDRPANKTYEAHLDLTRQHLDSFTHIPGVQPMQLLNEMDEAAKIVRADPTWQDAIKKRGITDFSKVFCDVWCPGEIAIPGQEGARLMRVISSYRGDQKNPYGPPIEGVIAVVNMNTRKVVDVQDSGIVPMSKLSTDYADPSYRGPDRAAPPPLLISQPPGPSYQIHGSEIVWQKWHFRYALTPHEGLVLYTVGYEDEGKIRPILYRASISEMLVPYADPAPTWRWRHAFDEGEYGLGRQTMPFALSKSAPPNATLLSSNSVDDLGAALPITDCIRLYERDAGTLWSHYDDPSKSTEIRSARELVIGFVITIANYDYGFDWIFHQDGTLEFQAALTGMPLLKAVESDFCSNCNKMKNAETSNPDKETRFGTLVAPNLVAPFHQHFINMRLDFDIDGTGNSVREWNVSADDSGERNPQLNAFTAQPTLLESELKARRDLSPSENRCWEIFNPNIRTSLGHVPGYTLMPGESATPYFGANTLLRQFASFVDHPLYVTAYDPAQLYAAGPYPNQSKRPQGLAEYSAKDRPIANQDVVVWYTLGLTHIPRPEDFPIMCTVHAGFKLMPTAFFTRNPALDVPAPSALQR